MEIGDHLQKLQDVAPYFKCFSTWIQTLKSEHIEQLPWLAAMKANFPLVLDIIPTVIMLIKAIMVYFKDCEEVMGEVLKKEEAPKVVNSLILYLCSLNVIIDLKTQFPSPADTRTLAHHFKGASLESSFTRIKCGLGNFLLGVITLSDEYEVEGITVEGLDTKFLTSIQQAQDNNQRLHIFLNFFSSTKVEETLSILQYMKSHNLQQAVYQTDSKSLLQIVLSPYRRYLLYGNDCFFDPVIIDGLLCFSNDSRLPKRRLECCYNTRKKLWMFSVKQQESKTELWSLLEGGPCRMVPIDLTFFQFKSNAPKEIVGCYDEALELALLQNLETTSSKPINT